MESICGCAQNLLNHVGYIISRGLSYWNEVTEVGVIGTDFDCYIDQAMVVKRRAGETILRQPRVFELFASATA